MVFAEALPCRHRGLNQRRLIGLFEHVLEYPKHIGREQAKTLRSGTSNPRVVEDSGQDLQRDLYVCGADFVQIRSSAALEEGSDFAELAAAAAGVVEEV